MINISRDFFFESYSYRKKKFDVDEYLYMHERLTVGDIEIIKIVCSSR